MKRIGLIVNPIAGMGGRVGLKGTDGLAAEAARLGAEPGAGKRTEAALSCLLSCKDSFRMYAPAHQMGAEAACKLGLDVEVVYTPASSTTDAGDTTACARKLLEEKVDLILFAGGDGTARDLCRAVGESVAVIGIPAGVKIHSPVYAQTPKRAGELAELFISGKVVQVTASEVLDIDEDSYRNGYVSTRLYGYLQTPVERTRMQARKAGTPLSERAAQNSIALDIIDRMESDVLYLIGPGSTTRPILENMGLPCSLLGIDCVMNRELIIQDAAERRIREVVKGRKFKIVVTPIGGQGYLFGRGNHQLSPEIIMAAGKDNIIVAATKQKIAGLRGAPFLIDTGCENTDALLAGYIRVVTGYNEEVVCRVR